jgi:Skp family chaperone for outer membrane proteins
MFDRRPTTGESEQTRRPDPEEGKDVKRAFVVAVVIGIGGALSLEARAQTPAGGAPPAAPTTSRASGRVAVFNVARVMKEYKKWQHFAGVMNQKRTGASADLAKLRKEIADIQEAIPKEPVKQKQEEMAKQVVAKQREFEDKERNLRKLLDEESAAHLRQLFNEIQACVKAIVDTNGFDIVFAYPDATTPEEMNSPLYYDLKMRPPAAMPFYVSPHADMTSVLVETLNKNFPPPVEPAGANVPVGGVPMGSQPAKK